LSNQLGKRFVCETCGAEALVTKAGEGTVHCCDKEMQPKETKALRSAD
jgi:transcription elongation factor Elf1